MNLSHYLSILLIVAFVVDHAAADTLDDGFGFSIGYGRMPVSNFIYDPALAQDPAKNGSEEWSIFVLTPAIAFNDGSSQLTTDIMFSGFKRTADIGRRPLVGGGTTRVSRSLIQWGLFLGFRERVLPRSYLNGGIGFISQGIDYAYNPPVINGGGGFSEDYSAWYWGLDFNVHGNLLAGFKVYRTQGSEEKLLRGGKDTRTETFTFHLTIF